MQQTSRGGLKNIAAGFMIIAFAAAILVAWLLDSWWTFFPVLLVLVGGFYTVRGLAGVRSEGPERRGPSSSSYYVFWGPTLVILGAMWFLSAETDVSGVLLLIVFLLWIGAVAIALSLRRRGSAPQP